MAIYTKQIRNLGLESRDKAKTFIYALIYGAGDESGKVVGGKKKMVSDFENVFLPTCHHETLTEKFEASRRGFLKV